MITHRVTTKLAPEPTVRFYRTIAVSFLIVTLALLAVIIFFTSKKAIIVVVAKTDSKNITLDINVEKEKTSNVSIFGFVTSTEFKLTQKYSPTGNKTINSVATGEAIIYNDTAAAQPLVKTTRLLTPGGVLFRLSDRVVVPARGQIAAKVYADQPGQIGDIGPGKFIIPGLSLEKQKVIYAESKTPMSGGVRAVGFLAEADIKAAETDYVEKVKQAADKFFPAAANFNQKLIFVPSHRVTADRQSGEEVAEFNLAGTSTVIAVYFNDDELNSLLGKEISSRLDLSTEKVSATFKDPQVALAGYDLAKQKAQLSAYQDALVTLDVNADKLAVANFFGKSKDEIERYVFGLGHVVGVDVKFSPSWMRSAPAVADRIQVIVKNVQ